MKLIMPHIDFSSADQKRNVQLPTCLDEKLAELVGILIGDGHIGVYKYASFNSQRNNHSIFGICISGNIVENEYSTYITNLFSDLFNVKLHFSKIPNELSFKLTINSKAIVSYLIKVLHICPNNKCSIVTIPELIKLSSSSIKKSFLRGIADTDFSFTFKKKYRDTHYYPVIKGKFLSKSLVEDLYILLRELEFKPRIGLNESSYDKRFNKYDIEHAVYLSGNKNFHKWINEIGFSNKKNTIKSLIWKKYGFYPPNLTYKDREKIMTGEISPASFYRPSEDLNSVLKSNGLNSPDLQLPSN